MKNLMQQLSPESLAIIEREKLKYAATVQNVINDLEKNYFPIYMTFETSLWLGWNICGDNSAVKIFGLFKNKNEEEVGS